ncbi:MAG: FAD-dependent oxidoreductase [Candidatus Omnitrophota bacterium]|nr:FAD-dependent oxidoreductase [Candidatus Omnitrophota bacterium]
MDTVKQTPQNIGAAVVIGAGIAGMQASLDLAETGIKVYLVEPDPAIGGRMTQLDKTFPTNECAMCVVSPKLVECARQQNIEIITNAKIERLEGESGNFDVTIYKRARFVDMEKCTACEECVPVCPVETPNKFEYELSKRKAIYRMYPQAVPSAFVIDKNRRGPCVIKCPAHINVQGYTALISQGKYREAFDLIKHRAPFPGVLGRVCYHPCESECNRKDIEEPIAINSLKRFLADFVYENKTSNLFIGKKIEKQEDGVEAQAAKIKDHPYSFDLNIPEEILNERKEIKIAVVGAGPCGLTAACDLASLGYNITIFEAEDRSGGMMALGIPSYRLPKEILRIEIDNILKTGIIEVKLGSALGRDFTLSDLKKRGFKAMLLATGANKGKKLSIAGSGLKGVWQGVDFLKRINLGEELNIKGRLIVIGGGNVAIDAARSALRLGAQEVRVICLESKDDMPAHPWETSLAQQEGVTIKHCLGPAEILGNGGQVTGIKFFKCLNIFDKSGKFNPVFDEKEACLMEADNVIIAIGQQPDLSCLKPEDAIETTGSGAIKSDPVSYATNQEGIFSAGDVSSGPLSVIKAIAGGKEAAVSIDRYIRKEPLHEGRFKEEEAAETPQMTFKKQSRIPAPLLKKEERLNNFKEVELTLTEDQAVYESKRCLNCGICSECLECEKVCAPLAINHNMKDERIKIKAGAVIIAPGVKLFDADQKKEYGYGRYDNVVTGIQLERILSSSGPTAGQVLRPSDGKPPKKIAFIQCVGSRDPSSGNEYCSAVCCMASIKEAVIAREHDPDIESTVFYIDVRTFGKDFERYYENAKKDYGVKFIRCMISKIYERPKSKNLTVKYIDEKGKMQEAEFELVVLAVGMTSTAHLKPLAEILDIETNEYGFCRAQRSGPGLTSRPGVFVTGTFAEPKDIPETVTDGSSGAALVSALLKDVRGSLIRKKEYPKERSVLDEDPRIGVFICRCGRNIASVVNVPEVVEHAAKLEGVVYACEFLYTCSKDALEEIKKKMVEFDINRVVVASCTPRTHEELFRDTVREAGLNRYLFEMTSLREQVSWVHKDYPEKATRKAKELVNMMVAKAMLIKPLERQFSEVVPAALVIGGGASGMQTSFFLSRQGFEVYLIEKEGSLGGHLRDLYYNVDEAEEPQALLKALIEKVSADEKIHVITDSRIKSVSGFVGNYTSRIDTRGGEKEIKHGTVIVATGAKAYEPKKKEFGYLESEKVINQVELEKRLTKTPTNFARAQTFVMIQCVGSRNDEHPYCSRVCCGHAIKNALRLKSVNKEHKVIVLYRDIRTYGFLEKYYLKAREAGVIFLCFDADREPAVKITADGINISHTDTLLKEDVSLKTDWVILSTGIAAGDNNELAKVLKIPLNADNFFLEAHAKIKPLDFTTEGMFFCGLAHSPRFLRESLAQAQGASVRAATILTKEKIEAKAITVSVDERLCRGCGLCVSVCPYEAREIDLETKTARVIEVLCQGCGACAVACPCGATTHKGFSKKQIMSMMEQTTQSVG